MRSAALRVQIEDSLAARFPVALTPRARTAPIKTPCNIDTLDELLCGGLSAGAITEFVGSACSGRTTSALAYIAATLRVGGVCAWIDCNDTLDPESAAACGVDLERLLWVRCGVESKPASLTLAVEQPAASSLGSSSVSPARHAGGGSPHPRSEGRDMPQAIGALLETHGGLHNKQVRRERRAVGTPGAANRVLSQRSEDRQEQVNSDRLPPRRGDNLAIAPRCAELQPRRAASYPADQRLAVICSSPLTSGRAGSKPWPLLDQALRSADMLLQGGGFSVVVLDLGSIPPEAAWRIPLATWFRFRAACERTRASLVVLTQHPCARSSAEGVVRLQNRGIDVEERVMTGIRYMAANERSRFHVSEARVVPIRKPPQPERPGEWTCEAAWARVK